MEKKSKTWSENLELGRKRAEDLGMSVHKVQSVNYGHYEAYFAGAIHQLLGEAEDTSEASYDAIEIRFKNRVESPERRLLREILDHDQVRKSTSFTMNELINKAKKLLILPATEGQDGAAGTFLKQDPSTLTVYVTEGQGVGGNGGCGTTVNTSTVKPYGMYQWEE